MASTTTNLGLTKPAYNDDADISDINGNMDLIDAEAGKVRANVAANYDSSETYAVGDYCLHDGSLYKCTTAISSPESWTAGHWTQIKIAGELSSLSDQIGNIGTATLLTTSDEVVNYNKSKTFDKTGYSYLMVVLHNGNDPKTGTWFAVHTLPTNYYSIHTGVSSLSWQSNGATGHCDVRYDFTAASTIRLQLDSKSSGVTPYVSVYGIK